MSDLHKNSCECQWIPNHLKKVYKDVGGGGGGGGVGGGNICETDIQSSFWNVVNFLFIHRRK